MIEINLLPEDRRPVEGTPWPRFLIILGGVVVFCLEIVVLGVFVVRSPRRQQALQDLQVEQERRKERAAQVDRVEAEINWIKGRARSIEMLDNDRRVWTPVLYALTDPQILPKSIWFKKVQVKKPSAGRGRGAGPGKSHLVIEGYVRAEDSGGTWYGEVTSFQKNLETLCESEAFEKVFDGKPVLDTGKRTYLRPPRGAPDNAPREALPFTLSLPLRVAGAGAPKGPARR